MKRLFQEEEQRGGDSLIRELDRELNLLLYAVSHDLRAPLRSIDGFSQAMMEDYANLLDDTGKDFLNRIRNAGALLNRYIDALLLMSRETRGEMVLEELDLCALAGGIASEMPARYKGHPVEFVTTFRSSTLIEPRCLADRRLMKLLLEKLLDNAWKFTLGVSSPRVIFGMVEEDGRPVYFFRDNGVGFDEKYAEHRLFGAFQKMHSGPESEGLGMGLATARRIINRHGGRIGIRSEMGTGTMVFFALEPGKDQGR